MEVRCLTDNPEDFAIDWPFKNVFWNSPGMSIKTNTYQGLEIGRTYVVYAVEVLAGFPFYYVRKNLYREHRGIAPSLCFEVLDDRPSRLWRYGIDHSRRRTPVVLLAIKEWVEEPSFLERLVDGRDREVRLMAEAAAFMDAEYE